VQLDDANRLRVAAHHESGHVFMAWRNRLPFRGRKAVTIIPTPDYDGYFDSNAILRGDTERDRLKMEKMVLGLLAGVAAQRYYDPSSVCYGESAGDWDGGDDYHQAVDLVSHFTGGTEQTEKYLAWLQVRAQDLVQNADNWACIKSLANALLEEKTLSAKRVVEVIQTTREEIVRHHYKGEILPGEAGGLSFGAV
jgi:hypothetical protein